MRIRHVLYPTGDNCTDCSEPLNYRAKFGMDDNGRQQELGREGPACWSEECPKQC